jgi:MYXO-CTERM domain-containing protein
VWAASGEKYCSRSCTLGDDTGCGGAKCMKTQYAGLAICARPGGAPKTDPAPNPAPNPTPTPAPDTTPPKVSILSPAALATVPTSFLVSVQATDESGVTNLDLLVDGALIATRTAAPFEFQLEVTRAGQHQIQAVAYDGKGNKGEALIALTVDAPTPSPATPDTGAVTPDPLPSPVPSPKTGQYGDPCLVPADCATGLCALDPNTVRQFCTQLCSTDACPSSSECLPATGGQSVCAPVAPAQAATPSEQSSSAARTDAFSCNMGGDPAGGGLVLLLLVGLALLRRR